MWKVPFREKKAAEYTSQKQDSGASLLDVNTDFALGKLLNFPVPVSSFIKWG